VAEDLSEEEKKTELLPILVQEIYVLSKQGKLDEASKLCESLPLEE
jgi:signal recognition particle subunit SRP72